MASLLLVPGVAGAKTTTLYVATTGVNAGNACQVRTSPCKTIGFAVGQAPSGATIKVAAGTYNEQVAITKPLTIDGAGATQTVIKPSTEPLADTDTDSTQPQFYIVDVKGTSAVTLENLGVSGAAATPTFDGDTYGCAQDPVGIYYHDASGTLTSDSVTGVDLPADLFGCQGGQGIYVATAHGSATPSNVTMSGLTVGTYDKNGITCDDPGTVCSISGSTIAGIGSTPAIAQNGIQIWASSATLTTNTITGNTYDGPTYAASGILIGNPYTLSVSKNQVTSNDSDIYLIQDQTPNWVYCGNTTDTCTNPAKAGTTFTFTKNTTSGATNTYGNPANSGYGDGLDLDSVTTPTTLLQNTANTDPANGISLYGAAGVSLQKNIAGSDGNGIYLGGGTVAASATGNSLFNNTISSAHSDGILADTASSGNVFQKNTVTSSGSFDARDNSTGSGTVHTANQWNDDKCTTSSPVGLCHTAL